MPQFEYDSTSIHFEEYGSGFPVLLIAAGGDGIGHRDVGKAPRSTRSPCTPTRFG